MSIDLRMPSINGNDREQLIQIRSYLYQLIPQLQWALNNVNTTVSSEAVEQIARRTSSSPSSVTGGVPTNIEATFAKLKPLIIKSADIVQAYYDQISSRLNGLYVAESDFGTFVEQTSKTTAETSQYVDEQFSSVQTLIIDADSKIDAAAKDANSKWDAINGEIGDINDNLDVLNTTVIGVQAYVRTGELYRVDEIPVYGVEVGQRNAYNGEEVFNKYARFTSDRLSFYDQNNIEVAYISDYKLYIRNVEITSSFKIGGFIDTVQSNGDIVTKWAGGDG
jgi:hypothetical protein